MFLNEGQASISTIYDSLDISRKFDNGSWFFPVRARRLLSSVAGNCPKFYDGEQSRNLTRYCDASYPAGWLVDLFWKLERR